MVFFVDLPINNSEIILTSDDAHHIKRVLRHRVGDTLHIVDKNRIMHTAEIYSMDNTYIYCKVLKSILHDVEMETKLILYQCMLKSDKMDYVIQKAIEIGIHKIVPVISERTIVKLDKNDEKKLSRYEKIAQSAAKQARRSYIPKICPPILFDDALICLKHHSVAFIPFESEENLSIKKLFLHNIYDSVGFIIGPEGGFSSEEMELAKVQGIPSVTLGKRILRAETAAIFTTSVLANELL